MSNKYLVFVTVTVADGVDPHDVLDALEPNLPPGVELVGMQAALKAPLLIEPTPSQDDFMEVN